MLRFLAGVCCGFGIGLLLAPAPGAETREQLMEVARDPAAAARKQISNVREKVSDAGARLGRQVAESVVDKVVPDNLQNERRA
jgi:gas vesicle protein